MTVYESWIPHKNDRCTGIAYWLPREEEPPAQPKPEIHERKVLLCRWWDARGMIYHELLTQGHTMTSAVYVEQLHRLAAALQAKKRIGQVHLLHDNARPHVGSATRQQLEVLKWITIAHPPYSPNSAPSDYHLFRALKNYLRGQLFPDFDSLKNALNSFFNSSPLSSGSVASSLSQTGGKQLWIIMANILLIKMGFLHSIIRKIFRNQNISLHNISVFGCHN